MANGKQRRHWMCTVFAGHVENEGLENFDEWWSHLCVQPGLRYAIGQVEKCPKTGTLHIQAYTEWTSSLRVSELSGRIQADWRFRRGSRSEARDYCRLATNHGVPKGKIRDLPEHGEWRPEGTVSEDMTPKQRALQYLARGMSPREIARYHPDVFFTHHRAILETYRITGGIFIVEEEE